VSLGEKSITAHVLHEGRYQVRGEFYTPDPVPVHTLPEVSIEWTEVFEGVWCSLLVISTLKTHVFLAIREKHNLPYTAH
jgi:hypothetical protein